MSALNSKIPSSHIPLHALEAQEVARQAQLLRNTDVNSNISQSLTDDYLTTYMTQLSMAENMLPSVDMLHAEAMDCARMLSELSPLSLNDNHSETALPLLSVPPQLSSTEMGNDLLAQLLGMPTGNNIFDVMPMNSLETTPSVLKPNEIDVITNVIDSLTNVISQYLPAENSVSAVGNNIISDDELLAPSIEDIYHVVIDDGVADLILNGKEITQNGVYANDSIEKKDDALIIHQDGYDIVFNTDDVVNIADDAVNIDDNTVKIADNTVKIADNTVKIADNTVKIADDVILVDPTLTADSIAKTSSLTDISLNQDKNTLINLDGEVIKTEAYSINSVFA